MISIYLHNFLKGTPSQTIILFAHEVSPRHGSSWKPDENRDHPTHALRLI